MKSFIAVLSTITFSICLLANADTRVQLLEFGTFKKLSSGPDVEERGVTAGARHAVAKVALVECTTNVPARVGTSFGFRVRFAGAATGAIIRCTAKCTHPRLSDPSSRRSGEADEWDASGLSGEEGYIGYTFDYGWELAPGSWTLEVFVDSELVLSKTFNVSTAKR